MTIAKDKVVAIEYTLTDDEKQTLDSSDGVGPLEYLHGHDDIISGLEVALEGKKAGDTLTVVVEPKDAYGDYHDELKVQVEKDRFQSEDPIEVGMQFEAESEDGRRVVVVTAVDADTVTIDANHPLAGVTLHFDVKIDSVRDATAEELEGGLHGGCSCGGDCDCGDECDCGGEEDGCSCGGHSGGGCK